MPGTRIGELTRADDGQLLVGVSGGGLLRFDGDGLKPYPIRDPANRGRLFPGRNVDSNKLLRDRDGGLWIGTHQRGLVHVRGGRTDVFTKADGLSGDIICSLFEDREGNIWVATTGGLDRFRELPVTTVSAKHGLSSDATRSVLAAADGSIWVAAQDGLTRWKSGHVTIFRKANGLPGDRAQSLLQDDRGRIWVFTDGGLAYLNGDRFAGVPGVPAKEVFSMTGDGAGGLWLSTNKSLLHLWDGRVVESSPWPMMGRHQQAKVVIADQGGVWLAFWVGGGVLYFKDGKVRESFTSADGLGAGPVAGLRLDSDGGLWAAIEAGGLSRIKDGRVATLTTRNGLPCDTIHWSIEDDDRSLWLYTACGLVRMTRTDLEAWIADPKRRIETAVWDAADGLRLRAATPAYFNPPVAKATDGRIWFQTGDGVEVVDPHHLATNSVPPPVHIERIVANQVPYWERMRGGAVSAVELPARVRDLQIDFTALSLVAPERVHFKYKLEGQDHDWREVVNERQAQYTNLRPGTYTFHVIASNNSGVWNEQGDQLDFSVAPAFNQTNWFRTLCVASLVGLLWAGHRIRLRQLHRRFEMTLDARVGERTRIARELHDTLLQSAHGVLLSFQTVSELLPERPLEAKARLDKAIEQTAEFITEARDEVQGLRESTSQTNDLALAINSLGEGLGSDAAPHGPVEFNVAVEGESRDLHPVIRDEIYKTAVEALRNAFRHAQARRIEVELRYHDEQFCLRVRDDGRGIDREVLSGHRSEGHFGLPGLRERAALIGANLEVWSEVDSGTEVEMRVPAHKAYAATRRPSWWSRMFARQAKT